MQEHTTQKWVSQWLV